jgi:hypothetical protein
MYMRMQDISLTKHFKLREFTESATAERHRIVNEPGPEAIENLSRLCEGCLEPLHEALELPVVITSGYRCKTLNNLIAHSSERSQHMLGQAADFYVGHTDCTDCTDNLSQRELLVAAFKLILIDPKIDFDQVILYPSFIHVSYVSKERNRHGILKALGNGKLGYGRCTLANALTIE